MKEGKERGRKVPIGSFIVYCLDIIFLKDLFYNPHLLMDRSSGTSWLSKSSLSIKTELLGLELREQSADDWWLSNEFVVFLYLRFINSSSSTTHAEPLLVCTRLKYLWRDRLCRMAFLKRELSSQTIFNFEFCTFHVTELFLKYVDLSLNQL